MTGSSGDELDNCFLSCENCGELHKLRELGELRELNELRKLCDLLLVALRLQQEFRVKG